MDASLTGKLAHIVMTAAATTTAPRTITTTTFAAAADSAAATTTKTITFSYSSSMIVHVYKSASVTSF